MSDSIRPPDRLPTAPSGITAAGVLITTPCGHPHTPKRPPGRILHSGSQAPRRPVSWGVLKTGRFAPSEQAKRHAESSGQRIAQDKPRTFAPKIVLHREGVGMPSCIAKVDGLKVAVVDVAPAPVIAALG